jgi:nucleoside-diphosphate-sugar epimerase
MRVFVTGASGFIGSELVRQLVASGHDVVGLVRSPTKAERVRAMGAAPIVGDVRDPAVVRNGVSGADAVAHLALPRAGETRLQEARDINVRGTNAILGACRSASLRSFVLASGAGGMYRHMPGEWVDESSPETPWTPATRDRFRVDETVRQAQRDWGLPAAILRPPIVYGLGSGFREFFLDFMRRGIYRVVGDGSYSINLVHVEDCANAWRLALEGRPTGETFIVVDDEPVKMRVFSDYLAGQMGVPSPGTIPAFVAKLVAGRDAVRILQEDVRFRNRTLREKLGWTPRYSTYRDGIPAVVEAYRSVMAV